MTCTHHGTYREGRWWWLSGGYTPAGVECWNGARGIDYLRSRPDVDPERIGVTGISGGGAATFWIAAADERVKAAVPVSGLSDLLAYVPNRVVTGPPDPVHPIPPEQLRVFPLDSDLPADAINARIDREFVPMAKPELPEPRQFGAWKPERMARLRQLSFHHFPDRIPSARALETNTAGIVRLETESPIRIELRAVRLPSARAERAWIVATGSSALDSPPAWLDGLAGEHDAVYVCGPRGIGSSRWTQKSPPNYVARSHFLLGRTVDSGRVWDLAAAARYVRARHDEQTPVFLAGEGAAAVVSIYAALLEPDIAGVALSRFPATLMDDSAPALLGALRVCDVPQALGLLAPRPCTLVGPAPGCRDASALYRAAGVPGEFTIKE
jgi:hypothetical protein